MKSARGPQMDFTGKSVWVTGAGQGIGLCAATTFVALGANVIGLDKAFAEASYPFRTLNVDIADHEQTARACAHLLDDAGRLDVLVNAAGILRLGATEEVSLEDWRASFDVNVSGAFHLLRNTIAQFKRQRFGAVVTIGSNAAHVPRLSMAAYCASKAALASLTHCVALELAPFGVRCNLVSPGSTDTPMQRSMWRAPDAEQRVIAGNPETFKLGVPLGKIATPQEIANVVAFLASDLSSHIVMQDIVVDGGAILTA
ncbi:2,3-dihydro-2,3-dihydroxybenzoate dehydrogenase [Methylosinus sp. Sm6]|uniref:2,3-dihydro-2,3-dihydroxybenzoate dehydrogenase n=1 Tax=Methylosinus sp. Sm6 TaxID=2866948 RepID=UPI00272DF964|nr:2,3-dihydro-2,3-dihydroxybenzoate dehydrogenase [Methylosinus sp. Sm6]